VHFVDIPQFQFNNQRGVLSPIAVISIRRGWFGWSQYLHLGA
jgi:hypothetical protein